MISGSPAFSMPPSASDLRYNGSSAKPCVVWPSKSPSSSTSATSCARSSGRPAETSSDLPKRNNSSARKRAAVALESFESSLLIHFCPVQIFQRLANFLVVRINAGGGLGDQQSVVE